MRLRVGVLGVLLIGSILAPAAPASAATAQVVSVGGMFVVPTPVMKVGDTLVLNNQDLLPHNIASTVPGQFASPTIAMGETAAVAGAEDLGEGQYQFVCTLHPWMIGVLVVQTADVRVLPDIGSGGAPAVPSPTRSTSAIIPTPTSVATFGSNLFVTSYALGALYRLKVGVGGLLENGFLIAEGFTNPLGVTVDPATGIVYVADSHPSEAAGRSVEGRVWAVSPNKTKAVVIDGLPNGRHNTNGMAVKDGRLYIANGNSTDDGVAGGEPEVPPYSGSLLSVPTDARGLTVADAVVEATGMRNVYDVVFRPGTTEAWMTTNGPDALEPFGEDLLHKVDVTGDAADFGFPRCLYRAGPGGPTDPEVGDNPVVAEPCGDHSPPEVTLGLHVSADGLAFGPPRTPWNGDLFIAEFGNFFGAPAGRKIVRVPIDDAGNAGAPVDVFVGAGPLDVTFQKNNMYVADFAGNQIVLVPPDAAIG